MGKPEDKNQAISLLGPESDTPSITGEHWTKRLSPHPYSPSEEIYVCTTYYNPEESPACLESPWSPPSANAGSWGGDNSNGPNPEITDLKKKRSINWMVYIIQHHTYSNMKLEKK